MSALDLDALDLAQEYVTAGEAVSVTQAAKEKAEGAAAINRDFYGGASPFTPTRKAFEAAKDARDKASARWYQAQEAWKRDGIAVLRALITRLRAAEARTAWQPIETAPLGEWVLGQALTGRVIHCKRTERGWVDDLGYAVPIAGWVPMPLPTAPEAP